MYRTLLAITALAVLGVTASAETITVCADGCDLTGLQSAIDTASDGDVIQLSAETYIYRGGDPQPFRTLGKAITIRGVTNDAGEPMSILDGVNARGVLIVQWGEESDTRFENLVIQNGFSSPSTGGGAGVRCIGSSPTFVNCLFRSNAATGTGSANGGAVLLKTSASPLFEYCRFLENTSGTLGGAVCARDYGSPSFFSCIFEGNHADKGGGALYLGGAVVGNLETCTLQANSSIGLGQAISINDQAEILIFGTTSDCCSVYPINGYVDEGQNSIPSWCDDCRSDVNCQDNAVNAADLGILIGSWGTSDPQCDINGDGTVSAADLGLLIGAWGPCQ